MGAFIAKEMLAVSQVPVRDACFMIERLVDANCEFLGGEQSIRIGICSGIQRVNPAGNDKEMAAKANPLEHQGIRIGALPIKPLVGFTKHANGIKFQFSDGIQLSIIRRSNDDVYYHLIVPNENLEVTRKISESIRRHFKTIGGDVAQEIDEIKDVIELR